MPCIYLYRAPNGKGYVGQTINLESRKKTHLDKAKSHKKKGITTGAFQNAILLYGMDAFKMKILEECPEEILNRREIYWIAKKNTMAPNGYNLREGGGSSGKMSQKTIENMRKAQQKRYTERRESKCCYEEAKALMHQSKLCGKGKIDFKKAYEEKKIPENIPKYPETFYKEKWEGWSIFLKNNNYRGKGNWRKEVLSYKEAKAWMHQSELCGKSSIDFKKACKMNKIPKNIPLDPQTFYKEEWENWSSFLKNNNKNGGGQMCSLDEFFEYTRSHLTHIKSQKEYKMWAKTDKRPKNIYYHPDQSYGENFFNRGGWDYAFNCKLAHHNHKIKIDKIQEIASKLGLSGAQAYYDWFSMNKDMTEYKGWMRHPNRYAGWGENTVEGVKRNWYWFLGNKKRSKTMHYCECGYKNDHTFNFKRHLRFKKHNENLSLAEADVLSAAAVVAPPVEKLIKPPPIF